MTQLLMGLSKNKEINKQTNRQIKKDRNLISYLVINEFEYKQRTKKQMKNREIGK